MTEFASASYTAGQLNAIVKMMRKQAGENAVERFLQGLLILRDIWFTWKTITLGVGSEDNLWKALEANGFQVEKRAETSLRRARFSKSEAEIELVLVSASHLGIDKLATHATILFCARELGLDAVPAEVGPRLRLAYDNQPEGECIMVAMEPIVDSLGHHLYGLTGPRRLTCFDATAKWNPSMLWVFARRKPVLRPRCE